MAIPRVPKAASRRFLGKVVITISQKMAVVAARGVMGVAHDLPAEMVAAPIIAGLVQPLATVDHLPLTPSATISVNHKCTLPIRKATVVSAVAQHRLLRCSVAASRVTKSKLGRVG